MAQAASFYICLKREGIAWHPFLFEKFFSEHLIGRASLQRTTAYGSWEKQFQGFSAFLGHRLKAGFLRHIPGIRITCLLKKVGLVCYFQVAAALFEAHNQSRGHGICSQLWKMLISGNARIMVIGVATEGQIARRLC